MRALMPLGEGGVYSVSEVCRILQPGMTPRKVHYWLNTDLLSEPPVYRRGSGTPTLLSFRQLLEIRVVQELRDRLGFSLPRVREAFAWLLHSTFAEESDGVSFARAGRQLVARSNLGSIEVPTNQLLLLDEMTAVEASLRTSRYAHDTGLFAIPSHRDDLACNVRILGGAACIRDTRIETSLVAAFADSPYYSAETVDTVMTAYPRLTTRQIISALEYEGLKAA